MVGADDKKIGDVSDILFDKDGKIEAYVVGVGGFLGIGAKELPWPRARSRWSRATSPRTSPTSSGCP